MDPGGRGLGICMTPSHPLLGKSQIILWLQCMGESFQDCSWIQDFEDDFLWKVSFKSLNLTDSNKFLWFIFSLSKDKWLFKTWNCWIFIGILQVLRYDFQKVLWKFWTFTHVQCSLFPEEPSLLVYIKGLDHNYRRCSKFWALLSCQPRVTVTSCFVYNCYVKH